MNDTITHPRTDVSTRQLTVRHGLMHGRTVSYVEKEVKVDIHDVVEELARVTWQAISSVIITRPQQDGENPLHLRHNDGQFVNGRLVVVGEFIFDAGDGEHPTDEKIPKVETSLETRFGPKVA